MRSAGAGPERPREGSRAATGWPGFVPTLVAQAVWALVLSGLVLSGLAACDSDKDDCVCCPADRQPPAAPRGLYSVTGDEWVTLYWLANTEDDLEGYHLLVNDEYLGEYDILATIDACGDCDWEAYTVEGLTNGETYYFAVIAFDHLGNESPFSQAEVWDTPRPEGFEVTLSNALAPGGWQTAGFDLSAGMRLPHDDPAADFWYEFEESGGVRLLVAGSAAFWPDDEARIQDMGWTADFDEIGFAPPDAGWSPTSTAEAIREHTYVLLTRGGNYAKIRVTAVGPQYLTFDWAFQSVPWHRQLMGPAD